MRTKGPLYRILDESGKKSVLRVGDSQARRSRRAPDDSTRRSIDDVTVLVDDPRWPAHGRLWSHLVSDSDLDELHAFAAANDVPSRAFDLDHYDVPEEIVPRLIAAGAVHVDGHELVRRLIASGLRITARERRGR